MSKFGANILLAKTHSGYCAEEKGTQWGEWEEAQRLKHADTQHAQWEADYQREEENMSSCQAECKAMEEGREAEVEYEEVDQRDVHMSKEYDPKPQGSRRGLWTPREDRSKEYDPKPQGSRRDWVSREEREEEVREETTKDQRGKGEDASVRIPPKRDGETPMLISTVLSKHSPACANPASDFAQMEHFRNVMLLENDPLDIESPHKKWYTVVTPGTTASGTDDVPSSGASDTDSQDSDSETESGPRRIRKPNSPYLPPYDGPNSPPPYDGFAFCALRRLSHVLDKLPDDGLDLATPRSRIDRLLACNEKCGRAAWQGITIKIHVPMQRLLHETDDRDAIISTQSTPFSVNEQLILKRGRNSWSRADDKYRVMHTEMQIGLGNLFMDFAYNSHGEPEMRIESAEDKGRSNTWKLPNQEFTELVDFAQYTEREVVEESPGSYIPVKTLQLVALADDNKIGSTKGDERRVVAVLKHMGHKLRYDEGKWWCWTQSEGWLRDDNDTNIKTAVKAAATDLETAISSIASRSDFLELRDTALRLFNISNDGLTVNYIDEYEQQDNNPVAKAKRCRIVPTSERGLSSFISNLQPWTAEYGFAKSFERCKDIAFNNCVQQMVPPFATRTETPADRVTNRFNCDLPLPNTLEKEVTALQCAALKPFLDVFIEKDVALREADKLACLLTGTCATMPEANIRVQMGPYNKEAKMFAGRVGKDVIGNHIKAILGQSMSTDWGMATLSAVIEPDKNNPGFEGLDKHLGHWITDGSATKRDDSGVLRKWGDLVKKIWAGGAPSHFAVTLKHKNKNDVLPRSNAVYVSAQRYNIGDDVAIWARIECSPFPRVGNILENQPLISQGVPCFEVDPNFVNEATNMSNITRGRHMRYLVDRAIAILTDPKAAYPLTDKHRAAKAQLKDVAGGVCSAAIMGSDDAYEDLVALVGEYLRPCVPEGVDSHLDSDLSSRRKSFQIKAPRCFCGKKPAANACSFQVSALADILKKKLPGAYAYYVQRPQRLTKLTAAVQCTLGLDATGRTGERAHGVSRDAIFGWIIEQKEGEINQSTSDIIEPPAQSKKRTNDEATSSDDEYEEKQTKKKGRRMKKKKGANNGPRSQTKK